MPKTGAKSTEVVPEYPVPDNPPGEKILVSVRDGNFYNAPTGLGFLPIPTLTHTFETKGGTVRVQFDTDATLGDGVVYSKDAQIRINLDDSIYAGKRFGATAAQGIAITAFPVSLNLTVPNSVDLALPAGKHTVKVEYTTNGPLPIQVNSTGAHSCLLLVVSELKD